MLFESTRGERLEIHWAQMSLVTQLLVSLHVI